MLLSIRNNINYNNVYNSSGSLFSNTSNNKNSQFLVYGFYGLNIKQQGSLTFKQLESSRSCVTSLTSRNCNIWFRVFPDSAITFNSKGSRMGNGVGSIGSWVFDATAGLVVIEISFLCFNMANKALISASSNLPLNSSFISIINNNNNNINYEISRYI